MGEPFCKTRDTLQKNSSKKLEKRKEIMIFLEKQDVEIRTSTLLNVYMIVVSPCSPVC